MRTSLKQSNGSQEFRSSCVLHYADQVRKDEKRNSNTGFEGNCGFFLGTNFYGRTMFQSFNRKCKNPLEKMITLICDIHLLRVGDSRDVEGTLAGLILELTIFISHPYG